MNIEDQLKTKTYYKRFMSESESLHPIELLGELFLEEQKQKFPDASYIRFAQGEVYFHHKDYEAAIYKWEQVHNELAAWARKNIADTYFELEQYKLAEENYLAIKDESLTLQTEVKLKLFSLYYKENNLEAADRVIKEAVELNPDYPSVTKIAKNFFEDTLDWNSAVELAKREAVRTESLTWFEKLKQYIHDGHAVNKEPLYFVETLGVLYHLEPSFFEQFVIRLWENYQDSQFYLEWLEVYNQYFLQMDLIEELSFPDLTLLYEKTYEELMTSDYLLSHLKPFIPDFLQCWIRVAKPGKAVFPAAAIFAWNEIVPDSMDQLAINLAEQTIFKDDQIVEHEVDVDKIHHDLLYWGDKHQLELDERFNWFIHELENRSQNYIGITGHAGEGVKWFYQQVLHEFPQRFKVPIFYKYNDIDYVQEIGQSRIQTVSDFEKYKETELETVHLVSHQPNLMLKEQNMVVVDIPEVETITFDTYVQFVDQLIYFFNPNGGSITNEYETLKWLVNRFPEHIVHAVMSKENFDQFEDQKAVQSLIKNGRIFTYELLNKNIIPLTNVLRQGRFIDQNISRRKKSIYILRELVKDFLQQRLRAEQSLQESIQKKEDILNRLNGAVHQLEDLQIQVMERIKKGFGILKSDLQKEISEKLPKKLKETAEKVTAERQIAHLHVELNNEMNEIIDTFINNEIMPKSAKLAEEWHKLAEEELNQTKEFLHELEVGFNRMLGNDRLYFEFDFQILEDWKRDIQRFTSKINLREEKILLRLTPSQILLKGAGKVLGSFSKSKPLILNSYRSFIENESYSQTVENVTENVLALFTLFEQGLDRDISLFFEGPFKTLQELISELTDEKKQDEEDLDLLKVNPEKFRDPLKIFEIRLLQSQFILQSKETTTTKQ